MDGSIYRTGRRALARAPALKRARLGESARALNSGGTGGLGPDGIDQSGGGRFAFCGIGEVFVVVYVHVHFSDKLHTVPWRRGMGSLIMGLKWLYQEVRQWVIQWLIRLGWLGPVKERVNAYDVGVGSASLSGRSARRGRPLLSLRRGRIAMSLTASHTGAFPDISPRHLTSFWRGGTRRYLGRGCTWDALPHRFVRGRSLRRAALRIGRPYSGPPCRVTDAAWVDASGVDGSGIGVDEKR